MKTYRVNFKGIPLETNSLYLTFSLAGGVTFIFSGVWNVYKAHYFDACLALMLGIAWLLHVAVWIGSRFQK